MVNAFGLKENTASLRKEIVPQVSSIFVITVVFTHLITVFKSGIIKMDIIVFFEP